MHNFLQRTALTIAAVFSTAVIAVAQQTGGNLAADEAVPGLMFFTLGIVLLVAVGALVYFLRKRSNREAAERGLGIDENAGRRPPR